jgi:hypothetical protein
VFGNPICTHYLEEEGGFSPDYIIDQTKLVGPDYVPTPNPAHPRWELLE